MTTPLIDQERLTAAIAAHWPDWCDLLQRLVRCPSEFEHEAEVTAVVEDALRVRGLSPIWVPFDPDVLARLPASQRPFIAVAGRRNVVARRSGRGGGRSLVLNAHLDVVGAGEAATWAFAPFAATISDDRLYGRGAFDDKAGIVLGLAVLDLLGSMDVRLKGDLVLQFVLEDEVTGNGSLLCLEAGHSADAAIILDGTRPSRGIDRHAGNARLGIRVHGRPASVSVSHMGLNAAEKLVELLLELRAAVFALNAGNQPPWTQFPSPNQFVTQRLDCAAGGPLVVPETAWAEAHITFTPMVALAELWAELHRVADAFATRAGLPQPIELTWLAAPIEPVVTRSEPLQAIIAAAAGAAGLGEVGFGPSSGTSDMRHFAARGIPCVLYGPGNGFNPHRPDEYFELSSLKLMAATVFTAVVDWCGSSQ